MGKLFASAGGKVYEVLPNRTHRELFRPFPKVKPDDPDPFISLYYDAETGILYCSYATPGGGPIVQERKKVRDSWVDQGAFFVGPDSSRTGVCLVGIPTPPKPEPPQHEFVRMHDRFPPTEENFQRVLSVVNRIPLYILKSISTRVVVHSAESIVKLYPYLSGVPTGSDGDGTRTYNRVTSAYGFGDLAIVMQDASDMTIVHEYGHGVISHRRDLYAPFEAIHATTAWLTRYEKLNVVEAWAQSFARWVLGRGQPDPRINPFLRKAFPAK